MSEFIEYPAQIDKAIRYIFEETLLVSDVQSAKTIGVGKYRMVTLDGELLERSGVITGGSHKSSLLARASLDNAQSKSDDLKSQRDALYSELSYIRDEGQKLRKERASLELKVRTKEAEIGSIADKKLRIDRTTTEIEKITKEITTLNSDIEVAKSDLQRFGGQEKALLTRLEEQKNSINQKQQEQKEKMSNSQRAYQKALEKFSSFSTETEALRQQVQLLTQQSTQLDSEILQCNQSITKVNAEKSSIDSLLKSKSKELDNAQTQLKEVSATVEKFYAKMQLIEQELEAVEKEEGQSRYVFDSQNKKLNDLNIKHATISTRLVDLKAEWEKNKQVELLQQKDKSTLEKLISDSESKISELGIVNLKAPEIFEQKKQEQEQLSSRVETLHSEKSAVISLIDEIETKKRKLFNDTFNVINENFKRLFSMVYNGEASLYLDDETNLLDAGLGMRVRGQHDKKDKHLESMSGGEKTLLALMFIFSLQMKKPAPFYILDEAESALDKQNAHKMAEFIKIMSKTAQFLTITHHDAILSSADVVLGVSRGTDGSKIVGVQLSDTDDQIAESTNVST
jgi:chromosome segregation protein